MTREITSHKVNGLNDALTIRVLGEPGYGNACHEYEISLQKDETTRKEWLIIFQDGPTLEVGFNGLSGEALLAIIEDRLLSFQNGPFACRENAIALTHVQDAMMWLERRTRSRINRGVEGTHQR
jgi:hypothetical protein